MPPKSKPGEGIVIVIDVGPGVRASTETTFYSLAKKCLINILQRKIFADKCRDMVGIVLFGTDETKNSLATNNQYQHVTVLQQPKFVDWDLIKLAEHLPRGNHQGDWLDALIVAMDLLHDPDDVCFGTKKIVLMTDLSSEFSDDQTEAIVGGLKSLDVELSVIGPSLDDDDDGDGGEDEDTMDTTDGGGGGGGSGRRRNLNWNGKPKTGRQLAAEALLRRIVAEVDGMTCSFEEAISQLIFFEKKSQGSSNWNAMMDVGPDLRIPVVGRIKMKRATAPSWKKAHASDEGAAVLSETSFHRGDEAQTAVPSEDLVAGFRFGTTLVPFGPEDEQLKYACPAQGAALSVLGFTKAANVPLPARAGDQVMVVSAKDGDEDGAVALSALIQGLRELNMVAVARRVYRRNLNPTIGALYPDITADYECLIWVGLPFQEDVRQFCFPSLQKATQAVSAAQTALLDRLITGMDLSAHGDGEEQEQEQEQEEEELDPTVVVNPQLQHFQNCLTHRALRPSEAIPGPEPHVLELLSPPERSRKARDALASELNIAFPTTKIQTYKDKKTDIFAKEKDAAGGRDAGFASSSSSALSASDLTRVAVTRISTATPATDFYAMLQGTQPNYPSICSQMSEVLLQIVECLSGESGADGPLAAKLVEGASAFRKEAAMLSAAPYNAFVRELKQAVVARGLARLWTVVAQERLGLITQSESGKSAVSEAEAGLFLSSGETRGGDEERAAAAAVQEDADYDDMLDDL